MTGVPPSHPPEQLIGALIPPTLPRQRPPPLPVIELPPIPPAGNRGHSVVLSVGRLDRSGRIPGRDRGL